MYTTYVHLTLPVRFITPTELQTDNYLPTYLPASQLPCTYRVRRLGTGRLREQDYANKHEYDTNRTPHTTTYVAVRSYTGSGTHETGESQERKIILSTNEGQLKPTKTSGNLPYDINRNSRSWCQNTLKFQMKPVDTYRRVLCYLLYANKILFALSTVLLVSISLRRCEQKCNFMFSSFRYRSVKIKMWAARTSSQIVQSIRVNLNIKNI